MTAAQLYEAAKVEMGPALEQDLAAVRLSCVYLRPLALDVLLYIAALSVSLSGLQMQMQMQFDVPPL